jgi:tRNA-binding EMAP/Myf-like protein
MLITSKDSNKNYLAKVVELKNIRKHENADRLRIVSIDFQDVVVSTSVKEGDVMVYFPIEATINTRFLAFTNSFRDAKLNEDQITKGYFDTSGRVRAVKLRGEKSCGCLFPIEELRKFLEAMTSQHVGVDIFDVNTEFDYYDDIKICEKYVVPVKAGGLGDGGLKTGRTTKLSQIVEGQFKFLEDTENFRKNHFKIHFDDEITISTKLHGCSSITSHLLVKRELNFLERMIIKLRISFGKIPAIWKHLPEIRQDEYGIICSSRKVIKSVQEDKIEGNSFYKDDIWSICGNELKEFIPKGISIFYEIVGYLPSGGAIQSKYDYGCKQGEHKIYVYKMTYTNSDGKVFVIGSKESEEFCKKIGFDFVPIHFHGTAKDYFPYDSSEQSLDEWQKSFVKFLEERFLEGDCPICKNKVPFEGICIRKESLNNYEVYKLKSFNFLLRESSELNLGIPDIEES